MILAGELLKKAEYLLTMGLHPSEVVLGYELARDKAMEELESKQNKSRLGEDMQLLIQIRGFCRTFHQNFRNSIDDGIPCFGITTYSCLEAVRS